MTAPGDMKNNLKILENEVRYMKYPEELDLPGIMKGKPQAFLPLYNHAFNNYSPEFTAEVIQLIDDSLYGKSDLRFMEAVYKVLRDVFNYKPSITKDQFFSTNGFAERKVMMCGDILKLIRERCRNYGPHKPTNPNIKVSAVIDNRRTSKGTSKQSLDNLVALEPSNPPVARKVAKSPRPLSGPISMHNNKTSSARGASGMGGEETGRLVNSRNQSPPSHRVNSPTGCSPEAGHVRIVDIMARSPDQSLSEHGSRDHTDAMETILSKVRDLPTQLASFMQAVESRLQKVEERLRQVEDGAKQKAVVSVDEMGRETQEELRQQMETLRSRLVLLENRVTLAETKAKDQKEHEHSAHERMEVETLTGPFGALERGGSAPHVAEKPSCENSFASTLVKNFSPIRREGMVFGTCNDTTLSEPDPRRSSTPTHPTTSSGHSLADVPRREDIGEPASDFSMSFRNLGLDVSTQKQVERIKGLLHTTKLLLPTASPENSSEGNL